MDFINDIENILNIKVEVESIKAGEYTLLLNKLTENKNPQITINLLQKVLKEHPEIKIIEITENETQKTIDKVKVYNQTGFNNTCNKENMVLSILPNIKNKYEFDFSWKVTESFNKDIELIDVYLMAEYHENMTIYTHGYEMVNYQDRLVFLANKNNLDLLNKKLANINFYLKNILIKNAENIPVFYEFQIECNWKKNKNII